MNRFRFALIAAALGVGLLTTASFASPLRHSKQAKTGLTIRWDIISLDFKTSPPTFNPGGVASALAPDGTMITFTGSGTFGGSSKKVTGGGNWKTYDPSGAQSGAGTYKILSLVSFIEANPQAPSPLFTDKIGDLSKRANGTAVLRIAYSGGSQGVLTVGCHGPGAPPGIIEGIAATKGFKTYYETEEPKPGVDANRTLFHVGV